MSTVSGTDAYMKSAVLQGANPLRPAVEPVDLPRYPGLVVYVFQPLDFPVYGLSSTWPKSRWLQELDWQCGPEGPAAPGYEQVFAIWLGHGSSRRPIPHEPWVLVGSIPLQPFGRLRTAPGEDPVEVVASTPLWPLTSVTTPELSEDQRSLWSEHVWKFIQERAAQYETWAPCTWTLDDTPIAARVIRWAGAWAGFSQTPEVAIVIAASAVSPDGLGLRRIRDGHDYHFDLDAPFEWPSFLLTSQSAAFGQTDDFPERPWPWHVDHQELLGLG